MSVVPSGNDVPRGPRWQRVWAAAVSRMPNHALPTGRWRWIGLSCLGIVAVVVIAGVVAGGAIGVGLVELVRMITAREPLVAPVP